MRDDPWWNRPELWVEVFAIVNVGFLIFHSFLAYSVNQFRNRAEYIALLFSATAPVVFIVALTQRKQRRIVWKVLGYVVGWAAILVGLTGVILPLESSFFYERTMQPDLLGAVCRAVGLYRSRISTGHEPQWST